MAIILNARGEPEVPDAIKRRLAALDGGFSLVLRSGCWWLMQRWRENDPRWKLVQDGIVKEQDAVNGVGAFPIDMPFDSMPAWIEKSLREYPVHDLKRMAETWSKGQTLAPEAEALKNEVFEDVIRETSNDGRVTGRRTIHDKKGKFTKKGG